MKAVDLWDQILTQLQPQTRTGEYEESADGTYWYEDQDGTVRIVGKKMQPDVPAAPPEQAQAPSPDPLTFVASGVNQAVGGAKNKDSLETSFLDKLTHVLVGSPEDSTMDPAKKREKQAKRAEAGALAASYMNPGAEFMRPVNPGGDGSALESIGKIVRFARAAFTGAGGASGS